LGYTTEEVVASIDGEGRAGGQRRLSHHGEFPRSGPKQFERNKQFNIVRRYLAPY
jgi:hypothetical protein